MTESQRFAHMQRGCLLALGLGLLGFAALIWLLPLNDSTRPYWYVCSISSLLAVTLSITAWITGFFPYLFAGSKRYERRDG